MLTTISTLQSMIIFSGSMIQLISITLNINLFWKWSCPNRRKPIRPPLMMATLTNLFGTLGIIIDFLVKNKSIGILIACIFFFYFVWGDAAAREIVDMLVTEYFLFVWFWSIIIFNYLIILKNGLTRNDTYDWLGWWWIWRRMKGGIW